jgi:hypothetical protein
LLCARVNNTVKEVCSEVNGVTCLLSDPKIMYDIGQFPKANLVGYDTLGALGRRSIKVLCLTQALLA